MKEVATNIAVDAVKYIDLTSDEKKISAKKRKSIDVDNISRLRTIFGSDNMRKDCGNSKKNKRNRVSSPDLLKKVEEQKRHNYRKFLMSIDLSAFKDYKIFSNIKSEEEEFHEKLW